MLLYSSVLNECLFIYHTTRDKQDKSKKEAVLKIISLLHLFKHFYLQNSDRFAQLLFPSLTLYHIQ